MFGKREKRASDMTTVQKILTYGLIAFMIYVFLIERRDKLPELDGESKPSLKVTNRLNGESTNYQVGQKFTLKISAADAEKLKDKPVTSPNDSIVLFEVELVKAQEKPEAEPVKEEVKEEVKKAAPKAEPAEKEPVKAAE